MCRHRSGASHSQHRDNGMSGARLVLAAVIGSGCGDAAGASRHRHPLTRRAPAAPFCARLGGALRAAK
jgi:hypothetical protein